MSTCKVYKGCTLLGSGSIAASGTTITGWTAQTGVPARIGGSDVLHINCTVAITSSTNAGASFQTRVTADNLSGTLTLKNANPFST